MIFLFNTSDGTFDYSLSRDFNRNLIDGRQMLERRYDDDEKCRFVTKAVSNTQSAGVDDPRIISVEREISMGHTRSATRLKRRLGCL